MQPDRVETPRKPTPSFKKPPVVEVVCGIQFSPIPGWQTSHYGRFWHDLKDQYTSTEDQVPLGILKLGDFVEPEQFTVEVLPPLRRVFLVDSSEVYLMQVQPNRFLHNWRKRKDEDQYPRFHNVYGRFIEGWNQFNQFLTSVQLTIPAIEAYELTYVNAILMPEAVFPRDVWKFLNFYKEFPLTASGAPPRVLNLEVGWPLGDGIGKMSLSVKHGKRKAGVEAEVLIAEFSAKAPANRRAADMESWFRTAHDEIVYTFDALTTTEAHKFWERIE